MTPAESLDAARRFMRYALEDGVSQKVLHTVLRQEGQRLKAERAGHGTLLAYVYGCRCDGCKSVEREHRRGLVYEAREAA